MSTLNICRSTINGDADRLVQLLPTLGEAEKRFTEREKMFTAVKALLAEYGNVFGLCLVHAHCTLENDEIMLGRGSVSQPEKSSELETYYPERWLSSGEPYEFTTRPTVAPPGALVEAFGRLTSHVGVLGLYHIDRTNDKPSKMIEHTEGRKNILMPYTDADRVHAATQAETAWDLSSLDPVTMACAKMVLCDTRTTRNSGRHKGRFEAPDAATFTGLPRSMKARNPRFM